VKNRDGIPSYRERQIPSWNELMYPCLAITKTISASSDHVVGYILPLEMLSRPYKVLAIATESPAIR
jgi:hypothetical protein